MFTYVLDNLLSTTNNKNVRKISLHQIIIIIENYWLGSARLEPEEYFRFVWSAHTFSPVRSAHSQSKYMVNLIELYKWENKEMEK